MKSDDEVYRNFRRWTVVAFDADDEDERQPCRIFRIGCKIGAIVRLAIGMVRENLGGLFD